MIQRQNTNIQSSLDKLEARNNDKKKNWFYLENSTIAVKYIYTRNYLPIDFKICFLNIYISKKI